MLKISVAYDALLCRLPRSPFKSFIGQGSSILRRGIDRKREREYFVLPSGAVSVFVSFKAPAGGVVNRKTGSDWTTLVTCVSDRTGWTREA